LTTNSHVFSNLFDLINQKNTKDNIYKRTQKTIFKKKNVSTFHPYKESQQGPKFKRVQLFCFTELSHTLINV